MIIKRGRLFAAPRGNELETTKRKYSPRHQRQQAGMSFEGGVSTNRRLE